MGVLDRWTKKATENAIETTKETLNDKLETYSGIIKIGLTFAVIVFGSRGIIRHTEKKATQAPQALPYPQQQPIVINNYYDRRYIPNGRQGQARQQHQNRRQYGHLCGYFDADLNKLSRNEQEALDASIAKYASLSYDEIKEKSHDVAWRSTARDFSIKWEDIAREAGLDSEELECVNEYAALEAALS